MSYNIKGWEFEDKNWGRLSEIIKSKRPAVVGLQEAFGTTNVAKITAATGLIGTLEPLPSWDPKEQYPFNSQILVDPEIVATLGESGSWVLDGTDGQWGSRGVVWAKLLHKPSGMIFFAFNTHWCLCDEVCSSFAHERIDSVLCMLLYSMVRDRITRL